MVLPRNADINEEKWKSQLATGALVDLVLRTNADVLCHMARTGVDCGKNQIIAG